MALRSVNSKMKRAHDAEDESEDDSGENLMEDLADDYVAIPELDVYDRTVLDERDFQPIDAKARLKAEVRPSEKSLSNVT